MNKLALRIFFKEAIASEMLSKLAIDKTVPSPPHSPAAKKLNTRELAQVFKQMSVQKKPSVKTKIAMAMAGAQKLMRPGMLHNLDHINEVAGLGVLAAPSIQHLRGQEVNENVAHGAEVAGLGMLAAPYAGRLANSASGGRLGNWAGNMWNKAVSSPMANKVLGAARTI